MKLQQCMKFNRHITGFVAERNQYGIFGADTNTNIRE